MVIFFSTCPFPYGESPYENWEANFCLFSSHELEFLPAALASSQAVSVMAATLAHLPPSGVEAGTDSALRTLLFDHYCDLGEYGAAVGYLVGLRMASGDDATTSPYYMTHAQRVDVFVKVAECYLEEDLTVEAEGAVTKAGMIIKSTGIGSGIMS